jgi:hypothetical protein
MTVDNMFENKLTLASRDQRPFNVNNIATTRQSTVYRLNLVSDR